MNSALMLCTNVMVRYNVLKVKLHCFRFRYNKAYSLLTFGIQLLMQASNAAMNGSLRMYVTLHLKLYFTGVTVKSHIMFRAKKWDFWDEIFIFLDELVLEKERLS